MNDFVEALHHNPHPKPGHKNRPVICGLAKTITEALGGVLAPQTDARKLTKKDVVLVN